MIANTTLATLIKRNTATPNLQANVFYRPICHLMSDTTRRSPR